MGKKVKKEAEPPPKDVFDPLTIESKKAATVVLMLNSPEEEILAKACEAIYRFALKGEENKATLLELGAVEPLTKLLTHEDKIVRRNATMIFGILASNNDVKKLLRELDVMNSVIAQLAPEEEVVIHEFASLCLANMSAEYTSKVQILEHGGLEPLVRLLASPDPDVKKNSVECIYNLTQDFQCRAALQELNAIPPILDLLKSEYPVIQLLALKTLGIITNDKEARATLRDNQGVDHLIKILETKELNDLHIEALAVIANCLEDMDTLVLIQQTGGLKKLLSFAENSTIPDIQKNAAKAITKAAYDPENRKLFHEQEVEKCLVALLGSENDETKIAASQAISAMCENTGSKEFFNNQGIPQLILLLKSDSEEVREAASLALANLTTCHPANAKAVAEADGVDPLVNILSSRRDGAVANAATVLANVAMQEPLRAGLQSHGVSSALLGPLRSANTVVQSKAALTVAATACDVEARTELRNSGGLEPLVELLRSKHDEVRRHASWAVMVCANDELTAVELCKLGKGRGKKEEEKVKEEEEVSTLPKLMGEGSPEKEWYPPFDPDFRVYVYEVTKSIFPITDIKEQIEVLARYVAEKMGGKMSKEKLHNFSWELHVSELKFQLKSNVVPIGQIKKGIFYHRALLFKALADKIGIGCSLVRGEYGRAWNEVQLMNESRKGLIGALPPPEVYIVDLMFHPGGLMKLRSREADLYRYL
ncbi:armadillo repeat-containing protein 3 isoform X7 [Prionailurus viverrinus]|uniref:armadillo repeat-containing protein 3 isoform X7 n=1 Tax=Prionailurus viverrinus TaxID=61388 RepID=UPI001FF23E17|nr:armadillo repeat-containing protein 3 isoform X7 [Prionailurus viverrinus]